MITGQVENYNLNKPPPAAVEEPVLENETKEEPVVEEPVVEDKNELDIQPIEKDDIFERPKIINNNNVKPKKKREMSEKQKAHLQKLIEKNKQRALEKKQKELEKERKKEEKRKLRLEKLKEKNKLKITEKKVGKTVLKPVQQENNFVNQLRSVDSNKSQSRNNYYSDMERFFGLFTKIQEKNEEIINKRVEQELNKRTYKKKNIYDNEEIEFVRRHPSRKTAPPQPQQLNRQESTSYKIDFSQYSHGSGYNKGNPYGF